jgi:hypothetical protein
MMFRYYNLISAISHVGMLVGGPFDGEEEEGNVVVIISDCRTVAGDGVMSEDVFTQSPVGI